MGILGRQALFELGIAFRAALFQSCLEQQVVEHAGDADAERPLQVVGVEGDLEVRPEALQLVELPLRRVKHVDHEIHEIEQYP